MTVTVTESGEHDTQTFTTTVDATTLRVPRSATKVAILADIDALQFSGPNPIPMPPVLPGQQYAWGGTCAVGTPLAPGLADIRASIAARSN